MSDIVCSVCGVPKPPICYEHSRARKGDAKTVCGLCIAARDRRVKHAYYVKHREKLKQKHAERLGADGWSDSVAASWESRGLV